MKTHALENPAMLVVGENNKTQLAYMRLKNNFEHLDAGFLEWAREKRIGEPVKRVIRLYEQLGVPQLFAIVHAPMLNKHNPLGAVANQRIELDDATINELQDNNVNDLDMWCRGEKKSEVDVGYWFAGLPVQTFINVLLADTLVDSKEVMIRNTDDSRKVELVSTGETLPVTRFSF